MSVTTADRMPAKQLSAGVTQQSGWISVLVVLASLPALLELPREGAAIGLAALVLIPYAIESMRTRRLIVADSFIFIGFMWVLSASAPVLVPIVFPDVYTDPIWHKLSAGSLDIATLWMYRGWAACSLAYWGLRAMQPLHQSAPVRPQEVELEQRVRLLIGGFGLIASISYIVTTGGQSYSHIDGYASNNTLDQIVHEVRQLSKVYIFLYFQARGRGTLRPVEGRLLLATLLVYAVIFAGSSSKMVAIEIAAMWILGNAAGVARSQIMRELLIALFALTAIYWIFQFVTAYREELDLSPPKPNAEISEVVSAQWNAADRAITAITSGQRLSGAEDQTSSAMADRLAYVSAFATILALTSGDSPYENAVESFLTPVLAVIPRDFVGTKVQFFNSGFLAAMLGWKFGGFSPTLPGTLYWAWGYEGVVLGMAALGGFIAYASGRGGRDDILGLVWRAVSIRLVLSLLNVGLDFQGIVIGCVRTVLFLIVIVWIAKLISPGPRAQSFNRARASAHVTG
jgi:hypothetical protein